MNKLQLTTLRLLPVVIASACGGRSALDDAGYLVDGGDGVSASGGRQTGGAPPHFGSGGTASGGRASAIGGALSPGESFTSGGTAGTGSTNQGCSTFAECGAAGCKTSELVVSVATPTSPAVCAPDPNYEEFSATFGLFGLSRRGTRAYVALGEESFTVLRGYESGALAEILTIPHERNDLPAAFALSPDGTIYLQGRERQELGSLWLEGHARDLSSSWHIALETLEQGFFNFGILTTDSSWLSWRLRADQPATGLVLLSAQHPDSEPAIGTNLPGVAAVSSIAADDQETVWLIGLFENASRLGRMGLTGAFEPIETLSESYYPNSLAVTPSGTAYVLGFETSQSGFEFFELSQDGAIQKSWNYTAEPGTTTTAIAIAVDPGRALYACFNAWLDDGSSLPGSLPNVVMLKLDLVTDEISTQPFVGLRTNSAKFMTVTTDGSVYIAGTADSNYFIRKVY